MRTGFVLVLPIMAASEHNLTLTYKGPDGIPRRMRTYSEPRAQPVLSAQRVQGDVDDVVNSAKAAWDFVKGSVPVVDLHADYATAYPKGADWSELEFEKNPHFEPSDGNQEYSWTDGVGKEVCKLAFRNQWYAHGKRSGHDSNKEKFIDQATQIIAEAHAKYVMNTLEASCSIGGPTNVGKDGKINAELTLQIAMNCGGVLGYQTYRIYGDGTSTVVQDEFLQDDAVVV